MMLKKIFMTVGLILIILLIISCRSHAIQINVHFERLAGLAPGDRVLFENNTAGHVDTIHYNNDGSYDVRLKIEKGFTGAATEYTRFRVIDDAVQQGHKAIDMSLTQPDGALLADGAFVKGDESETTLGDQLDQKFEEGFDLFKKHVERFAEDLKEIPRSDAYRQLKRSLSDLADEIERSEKQAREKLKEEWLPLIEKELEDLKRRLQNEGREEEAEPLQKEIDRIRKI